MNLYFILYDDTAEIRFSSYEKGIRSPKRNISRMSGDLACSFSGKEVKYGLANQKP
jgi:hypothetical protein